MTTQASSNGALTNKAEINQAEQAAPSEAGEDAGSLSTDEIFHLLQNQRRRRVLQYLHDHDDGQGVDMRDVVEWVAAIEHDTTVQALRSEERQRVYIALYQSHLPKLADAGVIEYDQRKGWIETTDMTPQFEQYVVEDEDTESESESSPTVRTDSAATGIGALLLVAGYSGFAPVISDFVVSIGLFALMTVMAVSRLYARIR